MKVDDLLQGAEKYIGKSIELEGYLIVTMDAEKYTPYLSPSNTINDNKNVFIEQPLAELRKIIQPMHTMIRSSSGTLAQAPYVYNFPLYLTAEVGVTAEGVPVLEHIQAVRVYLEHPPLMAKIAGQKRYLYTADVDYTPVQDTHTDRPTKASIHMQRVLQFSDDAYKSQLLDPDENLYARRILDTTVTIPGWLKYLPTENGHPNFVLRTFAVRSSMVGVGPLRGMTSIWWRPTDQYQVVRAHMPLAPETPDYQLRAEITGRIEYLHDETPVFTGDAQPQLAFTNIDAITVHQSDVLFDVTHDPTEDTPP